MPSVKSQVSDSEVIVKAVIEYSTSRERERERISLSVKVSRKQLSDIKKHC